MARFKLLTLLLCARRFEIPQSWRDGIESVLSAAERGVFPPSAQVNCAPAPAGGQVQVWVTRYTGYSGMTTIVLPVFSFCRSISV